MSTAALRQGVADLSTLANADLAELWRTVTNADEARAALLEILPDLCDTYGSAASTLAADWYDTLRESKGVAGSFSAITADLGDQGGEVLARWGIGPLFGPEPDWAAAQTLIEGGLQRRIANASRDTITGSSYQDSRATGWQRVGSGECAFCSMLIARGEVYSEDTAQFASHDHCNCSAVPAFKGEPLPVKPYTPSDRGITEADRDRVDVYLGKPNAKRVVMKTNLDATATTAQLRTTLAALEKSALKFSSPGTIARLENLRRELASRT